MEVVQAIYLCVMTGICALTDMKERKIKNCWLKVAVLGALFFMAVRGDWHMVLDGLTIMLLTFAVLYPLYLLRMMGAGDVKLMCVTGLYIGWKKPLVFWAVTGVLCAILALCKLAYYRNVKKRLLYFWNYIHCLYVSKSPKAYGMPDSRQETIGLALPVFCGVFSWIFVVYIMK